MRLEELLKVLDFNTTALIIFTSLEDMGQDENFTTISNLFSFKKYLYEHSGAKIVHMTVSYDVKYAIEICIM